MKWNKYTLTTTAEAEDMISSMMMPTGKAAMMDTVCRLDMEFSEKIRASGSRIRKIAQNSFTFRCGSSSLFNSLYV